jgi:diadenosine tetraphosphate (Ap4A) HIT family hydrolase
MHIHIVPERAVTTKAGEANKKQKQRQKEGRVKEENKRIDIHIFGRERLASNTKDKKQKQEARSKLPKKERKQVNKKNINC